MKLLSKPHTLLGLLGGIFLLFVLFSNQEATVDIHMHDLVIIVANAHVTGVSAAILLYLWLIYSFTYKIIFSRLLYWIHIVCTILFFILFYIVSHIQPSKPSYDDVHTVLFVSLIAFFIAQILFVVNLIGGIIKKLVLLKRK